MYTLVIGLIKLGSFLSDSALQDAMQECFARTNLRHDANPLSLPNLRKMLIVCLLPSLPVFFFLSTDVVKKVFCSCSIFIWCRCNVPLFIVLNILTALYSQSNFRCVFFYRLKMQIEEIDLAFCLFDFD